MLQNALQQTVGNIFDRCMQIVLQVWCRSIVLETVQAEQGKMPAGHMGIWRASSWPLWHKVQDHRQVGILSALSLMQGRIPAPPAGLET